MLKLIIVNRNYSSWSLRIGLLMRQCAIACDEQVLMLDAPDFSDRLAAISWSRTVPVLIDDDGLAIWDSLAITEYLAERYPDAGIWPVDRADRAIARSLCASMHAGFFALREHMPMNIEASLPGHGYNAEVARDTDRIFALWRSVAGKRGEHGPFLFGRFSAADAFFAPVLLRLRTYDVALPEDLTDWANAVLLLPALRDWIDAARAEHHFLVRAEPFRAAPAPAPAQ